MSALSAEAMSVTGTRYAYLGTAGFIAIKGFRRIRGRGSFPVIVGIAGVHEGGSSTSTMDLPL